MEPSFLFGELREAHAQGSPVPLQHTEFEITLFGPLARVLITQHFYNAKTNPIEAVYVMPLSHQGAVSGLSLWVGGRLIRGVIKGREKAKEVYEEARDRGAHAALLEQEHPNLFSLSVSNIGPNEAIRVELVLEEALRFDGGCWRLQVPLTYIPPYRPRGMVAEAWMSGPFVVTRVGAEGSRGRTMSVFIQGSFACPLAEVRTEGFAVTLTERRLEEGVFSLQLAAQEEIPDRDFLLEVWPQSEHISPVLLSHKAKDKTGTFLLTILPESSPGPEDFAPREVVFILDRSGSMGGAPLRRAKQALRGCLRGLGPTDTFSVVAFDDRVEELCPAPLLWSQQTIDEAESYLSTISERGGTEILPAFMKILKRPKDPLRQRSLVFLTDGAVSNVDQVLSTVERSVRHGDRIYTFGLGAGVNRVLLDGLARIGRGTAEYLELQGDIEATLLRFLARIAGPLLTDLVVVPSREVVEVYPRPLPDLFVGQALQLAGRWVGDEPVTLCIKGRRGAQLFEGTLTLTQKEEWFLGSSIERLWARRRVETLTEQLRQDPSQSASLRMEITGLGVLYHLVTPYTSLVAVEEEDGRGFTERPERIMVPNLVPRGVSLSSWLVRAGEVPSGAEFVPQSSSGFTLPLALPKIEYQASSPLFIKPSNAAQRTATPRTGGGIFSRVASLFRSNVNDAINKAEDPERMMAQIIVEMNQSLVEAKKQVAVAIAEEKRLAKQLELSQAHSREREKKAMSALNANDNELAKEAMTKKLEQDTLTLDYQEQHQRQRDATNKLKTSLRGLQGKIDEARRKKDPLIARSKRAASQPAIQSTLSGLSDAGAFDTFDRMAQRVEELEPGAEASGDLQLDQPSGTGGADSAPVGNASRVASELPTEAGVARAGSAKLSRATKPAEIPEQVRVLARSQRASGAWGEARDDLKATCAALVQMAAAHETHRAGLFQAQLTRAVGFLSARLATLSGEELLLVIWTFGVLAMTTNHPVDLKRWRGLLDQTSTDESAKPLREAETVASLLQAGDQLFFDGQLLATATQQAPGAGLDF